MTGRYMITSKASPGICPRCRELILIGVVDGLTERVDPYPVGPVLEAVAILTSRRTFTLHLGELWRREGQVVHGLVLVGHVCDQPLRDELPAPPVEPAAFLPPF